MPRRLPFILCPLLCFGALLGGCGPRPDWSVQWLADPGLPVLSEEELGRCEEQLRSGMGVAPAQDRPADPTNFGTRSAVDAFGRQVPDAPQLIVLHETVMGEEATLSFFQTPHPNDEDQASYHILVNREGQRWRLVPDEARAFGAGMSAFGDFTVRINPESVGSINNVALHLSLVTPEDGRGNEAAHSGYTQAQYATTAVQVLVWQARHGIPLSRLTTHAAVDRSHSRYDPRSFRWDAFDAAYRAAVRLCGLEGYDAGRATT